MGRAARDGLRVSLFIWFFLGFFATGKSLQGQAFAVKEIQYPSPAEERMLAKPVDLEVYGARLYVLDSQERKIKVYSLDGKWEHAIGRYGSGPGELIHPVDMSIHGDGAAVLDSEAHQIQFFSVDGSFLNSFKIGFRGYRLAQVNPERVVVSRLPRLDEKNASLLFYFDRQGKLVAETYKVSSSGDSIFDFFQFNHDLRSIERKLAVVKKFGRELAVFYDEEAKVISSLKIEPNYPSISFRVNRPKTGRKEIQAFAFASTTADDSFYLVLPTRMADGDLGPSGRVAVLGSKGEFRHYIDFPVSVYKLAVSKKRFFVIDEDGQLRIFNYPDRTEQPAGARKE